jgi:hypothetical protein
MDLTAFEHWLGGFAALTCEQRQKAWQALALSDTNVERFSLDGAAHRLLRGVSAVGSRR